MIFLLISVVGVTVYLVTVALRAREAALSEVAWVMPMLWTLGLAMAAGIGGDLVVSALRKGETALDVRDLEIRRYGLYVGHFFGVIGGVTALGLTMLDAEKFFIAHALYAGFVVSALVSAVVRLRAYRRGLPR